MKLILLEYFAIELSIHSFREKNIMSNILNKSAYVFNPIGSENAILGHRLFGAGSEKVIVLHSWMGDSTDYEDFCRWADANVFTYAFVDIRGYGLSKAIDGKFTSDEIASDVMALADFLQWERFHLIGHSMNGLAGTKTLMLDWKNKKRIKTFVAITPVTPNGYPATQEDREFLYSSMSDVTTTKMALSALTGGMLNNKWADAIVNKISNVIRPDAMKAYFSMWLDENFLEIVKASDIHTPTMVIGGKNDLPGFQKEYYESNLLNILRNVKFTLIESSGHFPMFETPIRLVSIIEKHLHQEGGD